MTSNWNQVYSRKTEGKQTFASVSSFDGDEVTRFAGGGSQLVLVRLHRAGFAL